MSTIDKRIYIDALRQRLGDVVPANDMERILTIADDVLIDFDIHSVGQMGEDLDSGQLLREEAENEDSAGIHGRAVPENESGAHHGIHAGRAGARDLTGDA